MMPAFPGRVNRIFYLYAESEIHSATIYLKSQPALCQHHGAL